MEKPEMETPKPSIETTPFSFPPHRPSHLRSETYRTLARIISHCYGQSQVSLDTTHVAAHHCNPDNGGNELGQATETGTCERVELVSPDCAVPESLAAQECTAGGESYEAIGNKLGQAAETGMCERGELVSPDCVEHESLPAQEHTTGGESYEAIGFQDKGSSDIRMTVDELDLIMRIDENEDFLKQMDTMVDDSTEGTGSQDRGSGRKKVLMNELMQLITDNEEHACDNNSNRVTTSLDKKQNGDGVVALVNNLEENFDRQQIVMEESGVAGQLLVDKEHCNQTISEAFDSSVDKGMTNEVPKPSENSRDKSSSLKTNASEAQHEIQQKEMEMEKAICNSGTVGSPNHMSEEGDIEEGEISGDGEADDNSRDMYSEDAVVSKEKKADEMQVSELVISKKEFAFYEQSGVHAKDSESNSSIVAPADNVSNSGKVELKGNVRNLVYYGEILEQSTAGNQEITLKAKQDAGICNKRKRGTSMERKAKKRQNKQKKRAEENRKLGVKRLKLETVLKPKAVSICRHYLKGRCQEDDKCKFSHDAVPLTKSKPCCHFARHSCMKGDDCPFDHQLSKYPCSNFAAKGVCSRGDDCMFSHKIPLKEDAPSPSNACKAELKPPSLSGNLNTKMQLNTGGTSRQNVGALSNSVGDSSCKNSEQNMAETLLKPPAMAPKGINCLFVGKSPVFESSKLKQVSSSPKRNESGKVGNQTNPSASGTVQNINEIPNKTPPAMATKGINFLSFGNSPLKDSSIKKIASLPLNKEDNMKSSLLNNFSVFKQGSSTPNGDDSVKVGNQTSQSASSTIQKSNEMPKKSQPAAPPLGMNFLSIGNALMDESRRNKQYGLPSSSNNDTKRSVQESQNASDKHQSSPWMLSASPLASGQSPDQLAGGHYKNTPNSVQKALMSTLAFAAKFESRMKINRATVSTEVNKETGNSCGSSQNDSEKASKILEFLSNPFSITKQ